MRKSLRRNGHLSEHLIYHIELALVDWLHTVHVALNPYEEEDLEFEETNLPGQKLWEGSPIREVARSRKRLVWQIEGDGFARYVVHCCCRFHSIISYSKYRHRTFL